MIFDLKHLPIVLLLAAGVVYSIYAKKLTPAAAFTGLVCGLLLYAGAGYLGILMLTVFFLCGTLATSWSRTKKQLLNKPGDHVRRNAGQVLANAGMSAFLAGLMVIFPMHMPLLLVMLSAAFASAMADTLSSELGMVYGKRFYNCISWQQDQPGLDGVVSLEGTLIGLTGAMVIALMYALAEDFNINMLVITFAGVAGNYADSFLGAKLERKSVLTNNGVNFISTLLAALFAMLLFFTITLF